MQLVPMAPKSIPTQLTQLTKVSTSVCTVPAKQGLSLNQVLDYLLKLLGSLSIYILSKSSFNNA